MSIRHLRHLCKSAFICGQELFDLLGSLRRRDYGDETLANVIGLLKFYLLG